MFRQKPIFKEIQLSVNDVDELIPVQDDLESNDSQLSIQIEQQQSVIDFQNTEPNELNWRMRSMTDQVLTFPTEYTLGQYYEPENDNLDFLNGFRAAMLIQESQNQRVSGEVDISNMIYTFTYPNQDSQKELQEYYDIIDYVPGNRQDSCCICLNDFFETERIAELRCKHHYHQKCIEEWSKNQRKCPLCKADMNQQELNN